MRDNDHHMYILFNSHMKIKKFINLYFTFLPLSISYSYEKSSFSSSLFVLKTIQFDISKDELFIYLWNPFLCLFCEIYSQFLRRKNVKIIHILSVVMPRNQLYILDSICALKYSRR